MYPLWRRIPKGKKSHFAHEESCDESGTKEKKNSYISCISNKFSAEF